MRNFDGNYRQCNYYFTRKRTRRFGLTYLVFSILACFFGGVVALVELATESAAPITAAGVWGSILGFISAALCYFATKPKTNRIPIMRAHMAMAFINIVVAAVALTVILETYWWNDLPEDESILVAVLHITEMVALGGLIFVSCGSVLTFIFYHMKCEFVAEPMQLAENEIVIRNAVGETVILSLDNISGPGSVSQNSVVSVRVLPTYDEIFNKPKEQAF